MREILERGFEISCFLVSFTVSLLVVSIHFLYKTTNHPHILFISTHFWYLSHGRWWKCQESLRVFHKMPQNFEEIFIFVTKVIIFYLLDFLDFVMCIFFRFLDDFFEGKPSSRYCKLEREKGSEIIEIMKLMRRVSCLWPFMERKMFSWKWDFSKFQERGKMKENILCGEEEQLVRLWVWILCFMDEQWQWFEVSCC